MAGRMINGAAALAELVGPAAGVEEPGIHRVLPVLPVLSGLLPARGLRRGSTIAIVAGPLTAHSPAAHSSAAHSSAARLHAGRSPDGLSTTGRSAAGLSVTGRSSAGRSGAGSSAAVLSVVSGGTSLLLAMLSAASRSGSWCAVVGVPGLGGLAAAENGIVLDRLALVPHPGPEWPTVVAALIDGVDVVVTAIPGGLVSASVASRLAARARQRGSVLMPYGWWAGADVTLQVVRGRWEGLGAGRGRLRRRAVTITARGRGAAARPKEVTIWMPDAAATARHPAAAVAEEAPTTGESAAVGETSAVAEVVTGIGGR